ncbi:MAG TPA: alginate lyase family protein [Solirubrobacterales bacterium]|nr:alginate lyase family protein [Solirubrobacterales bacterium]
MELWALELPEAQVVGPWRVRRPTRKAILSGRFYVYGHAEELRPTIDWLQDPHGSRTWRYELQTLTWLKEALARHATGGDVETLAVARDVVLDWARVHLLAAGDRGGEADEQSEFAWYDMAVGLRAPYVAYVLSACLADGTLDDGEAELLLEAAERHGDFLADGGNYAAGNNHGLFQDEGLYLLARLLPESPAAPAWRELAVARMKATLGETVSFADGAHLEHSPAYQLAILDMVARLAANVSELPELGDLLERMRRTAAWQVTPGGRMAQLGDTDDLPAPQWARETAATLRGMNALPESGQAFVRDGESYLAVSSAYHSSAHKHADDAGFLLVEGGRVVLGDAGRWGYYETEPDRLYARSASAHNVLTVDGRDFEWRGAAPYGSGLLAAGEGDGWSALVVRNPLLAGQGVEHQRILLYQPQKMLVVIDEVRSDDEHEYTRHFHFGPELTAREAGKGSIALSCEGIPVATLFDPSGEAGIALDRGREDPLLGWTYPGDRQRNAVCTATLRSHAADATLITVLSLGQEQ